MDDDVINVRYTICGVAPEHEAPVWCSIIVFPGETSDARPPSTAPPPANPSPDDQHAEELPDSNRRPTAGDAHHVGHLRSSHDLMVTTHQTLEPVNPGSLPFSSPMASGVSSFIVDCAASYHISPIHSAVCPVLHPSSSVAGTIVPAATRPHHAQISAWPTDSMQKFQPSSNIKKMAAPSPSNPAHQPDSFLHFFLSKAIASPTHHPKIPPTINPFGRKQQHMMQWGSIWEEGRLEQRVADGRRAITARPGRRPSRPVA
ncbi:hypothetical protein ACLOJK_030134 [Asimina triloba]